MTESEAIKLIENDLKLHSKDLSSKYKNGLRMAIQALEKQIPKKIVRVKFRCPECEAEQTATEFFGYGKADNKITFCWSCGQKLDWSEED